MKWVFSAFVVPWSLRALEGPASADLWPNDVFTDSLPAESGSAPHCPCRSDGQHSMVPGQATCRPVAAAGASATPGSAASVMTRTRCRTKKFSSSCVTANGGCSTAHVAVGNSNTGGMIAPGCATRSARWLAASGAVGCGRLQPTSSRRGLFFERNRQSVRPLRAATAETKGMISCESLQLIASSRAQSLTATNEKSRSVDRWVARDKFAASGRTGSERDQSAVSGVRPTAGRGAIVKFRKNLKESGEPPRNRTENPQIKSRIKRSK